MKIEKLNTVGLMTEMQQLMCVLNWLIVFSLQNVPVMQWVSRIYRYL